MSLLINQSPQTKRIDSIDALRAFALFGILVVHLSQLYNFDNYNDITWYTPLGQQLKHLVSSLFSGRCRIIFSILFGVSFYLILRNPSYSIFKFCWRCVILMFFGFVNNIFYSSDILWWYGINGIILAILPVRKLQNKYILTIGIVFYMYDLLHITRWCDYIFPGYNYSSRYIINTSLSDYLQYPYLRVIKEQLQAYSGGMTETISFFIFGYYLGKKGIINQIESILTKRVLAVSAFIYFVTRLLYQATDYMLLFRQLSDLSGAFFYAILFIKIYLYVKNWLLPLTNYGRLGLTNYSLQNILWPIIIITIIIPYQLSFEFLLIVGILFYILQLFLSYWWLKMFKFGPLEYFWRIVTNRKIISNIK